MTGAFYTWLISQDGVCEGAVNWVVDNLDSDLEWLYNNCPESLWIAWVSDRLLDTNLVNYRTQYYMDRFGKDDLITHEQYYSINNYLLNYFIMQCIDFNKLVEVFKNQF